MEIDDSAALFYYTYHMMNWDKLSQKASETRCMSCGEKMMNVEPIKDKKGVVFEGLVCHRCKTVLWARSS
jgi:uncharacterized protein with PIN domain